MRQRGRHWTDLARRLALPSDRICTEPRPSVVPPTIARPTKLPVTAIETLIRDPYQIYARYVLNLRALDPILPAADARLRGIALHDALARVICEGRPLPQDGAQQLLDAFEQHLSTVPFPATVRHWRARFQKALPGLVNKEEPRATAGRPVLVESNAALDLSPLPFTLTARVDRIDRRLDGSFAVYDYKSGSLPQLKEVENFNKQLPLIAAMVERGAFTELGSGTVAEMAFIGIGAAVEDRMIDVTLKDGQSRAQQTLEGLTRLVAHYLRAGTGFTARRAASTTRYESGLRSPQPLWRMERCG